MARRPPLSRGVRALAASRFTPSCIDLTSIPQKVKPQYVVQPLR